MTLKNPYYLFLAMIATLLAGCEVNAPINVNAKVDVPTQNSHVSTLSCALSIPSSTVVSSGQSVPLTLRVTGGQSPYMYAGVVGTFVSEVSFSKTYTHTGTGNTIITDAFQITDNVGATATCSIQITVEPPSPVSDLACALNVDNASPRMNDSVNFSLAATGGTGPYYFSDFTFGNAATPITALYMTSLTTASAVAKYTAAGLSTASVILSDSNGGKVACSKILNIQPGPSLTLSASPSTSVPVGNTITLTPTALNFSSSPTLTFTSSTVGIRMITSGNNVLVSVTDGKAHTATIQVTASNGTQSVSSSIQLSFTTPTTTTLACTATTTYNPSYAGEFFLVRASVTSQNTVGTIRLTQIQTSWNASISRSYYYDTLSSYVAIYNPGTFPIVLTVTDDAGHTATCSTTQVVW